jgi:hypothetical protein
MKNSYSCPYAGTDRYFCYMVPLIIEMVRKGYDLVTFAAYIVYKKANEFVVR